MNKHMSRLAAAVLFAVFVLAALRTSASAPAGRYTTSNGTAYDSKTKLTWQQAAPTTPITQANAAAYCSSLSLNGPGWRLPTLRELMTLVDFSIPLPGPTIDATTFPNTTPSAYWTSTPFISAPGVAWFVTFYRGNASSTPATDTYYVRCVR